MKASLLSLLHHDFGSLRRRLTAGYTSNNESDRQYAWERTTKTIDIARAIECKAIVLWLAREGSYIRESKNAKVAYDRNLETINR